MKTVVSKWGNSIAVRIPKPFALQAGMRPGKAVDMMIREASVIIATPKPTLKDLVKKITPQNRHSEFDFGKPVGKEIW